MIGMTCRACHVLMRQPQLMCMGSPQLLVVVMGMGSPQLLVVAMHMGSGQLLVRVMGKGAAAAPAGKSELEPATE